MATLIFWVSLSGVAAVYFGYPFLLLVWSRLAHRPVSKKYSEPSVSVIIAAHNERETLERKLRNCFELDYPKDKLQVVFSLDGPTDGSYELLSGYHLNGLEVVYSPGRRGKAAALNSGVVAATGEVLVFTDARQRLDARAVRELTATLQDPSVGAASGELVLLGDGSGEASGGGGLYWRYEKWLRSMESAIHSTMGATGALYAIRRQDYQKLSEETVLDDVAIPMSLVLRGKRVILDSTARAYDAVSCCPEVEYRRKVRTLMGNYQLLAQVPGLLDPERNPVFVQFVLHKVARLLVPYLLISLLLSNVFLRGHFYAAVLACQAWAYLMAFGGYLTCRSHRATHVAPLPSSPEKTA